MKRQSCPMLAAEVLNAGFAEARAHLIEIAAFLDRLDRAGSPEQAKRDFRYLALRKALDLLASSDEDRAKSVLLTFSDPTTDPLESAKGLKGAYGAWNGGAR